MTTLGAAVVLFIGGLIVLFVEAAKGFLESRDAQSKEWEAEQARNGKYQESFDFQEGSND